MPAPSLIDATDHHGPERLAELTHPPTYKTFEERRAALKQATEGFRVKVRITPDMYGRR